MRNGQETCESVAEVTRELGVQAGTLDRWVCRDGVRPRWSFKDRSRIFHKFCYH